MGDLSARRALHLLIRTPHDFSFAKHDEEIRPMIDTVASEEGNGKREDEGMEIARSGILSEMRT
jgi:hypothetical protein